MADQTSFEQVSTIALSYGALLAPSLQAEAAHAGRASPRRPEVHLDHRGLVHVSWKAVSSLHVELSSCSCAEKPLAERTVLWLPTR